MRVREGGFERVRRLGGFELGPELRAAFVEFGAAAEQGGPFVLDLRGLALGGLECSLGLAEGSLLRLDPERVPLIP